MEPTIKKTTISWRIYKLIEQGVLQRIGRGKYKIGKQKEFVPEPSKGIESLFLKLKKEYPFLDISIWTTEWLAQWMLHLPNKHMIIIEVEKDSEESVFYYLSERYKNVFLKPDNEILNRYVDNKNNIVVVKNLVTGAPLQEINKIKIPHIEKILVDLLLDTDLFSAYQGRDLDSIIENYFEHFTINKDKMLRYADRRRKKNFVAKQIKKYK
ncbi:MAG: hypothetical protein L3J20_03535 [Flavobacteriaceae bacterium]|nr:hypothetical protein [Flavobacteriaceae bacterium]